MYVALYEQKTTENAAPKAYKAINKEITFICGVTRCLVNNIIRKRKKQNEIKNLKQQDLFLYFLFAMNFKSCIRKG